MRRCGSLPIYKASGPAERFDAQPRNRVSRRPTRSSGSRSRPSPRGTARHRPRRRRRRRRTGPRGSPRSPPSRSARSAGAGASPVASRAVGRRRPISRVVVVGSLTRRPRAPGVISSPAIGAATSPPRPPCSTRTAMATRGASAGAKPMNHECGSPVPPSSAVPGLAGGRHAGDGGAGREPLAEVALDRLDHGRGDGLGVGVVDRPGRRSPARSSASRPCRSSPSRAGVASAPRRWPRSPRRAPSGVASRTSRAWPYAALASSTSSTKPPGSVAARRWSPATTAVGRSNGSGVAEAETLGVLDEAAATGLQPGQGVPDVARHLGRPDAGRAPCRRSPGGGRPGPGSRRRAARPPPPPAAPRTSSTG